MVTQQTRVVHVKRDTKLIEGAKRMGLYEYIGRPSIWGNNYSHKPGTLAKHRVETVEQAVDCYERDLKNNPRLMAKIASLKGKVLGCWCKVDGDEPCHGDVLARLADAS